MKIHIESAINDKFRDADNLNYVDRAISRYSLNPMYSFEVAEVMDDAITQYANETPITIYRGLNFDTKEDYATFINTIKNGKLECTGISSWSPDRDAAEVFAITKPSYMEFMDKEKMAMISHQQKTGERLTGYRGVLLKTTIQAGVGLDMQRTEHAKETEIILPAGTYKVEIEDVLSYKDMFEGADPSDIMLTVTKKDLDARHSIIGYIFKNYTPNDINDNAKHHLFQLTCPEKVGQFGVSTEIANQFSSPKEAGRKIIGAGIVVPGKNYTKWYTDKDNAWLRNKIAPNIKKMMKQVYQTEYEEGAIVKWRSHDISFWVRFTGVDIYVAQLQKQSVGKEYHKQDEITRDINKIKDPQEQRKAIDDEAQRVMRILQNIG